VSHGGGAGSAQEIIFTSVTRSGGFAAAFGGPPGPW